MLVNEELQKIKLDTVSANPAKYYRIVKAISQNKTYIGVMSLISISSIESIIESWETNPILGAARTANIGATIVVLKTRYLEGKYSNVSKLGTKAVKANASVIQGLQRTITRFGFIGVVFSTVDAIVMTALKSSNDKDAAWLYATSGALGVLGFAVPLLLKSTAGGIAGLIIAGVSIGVYLLAQWFTDSDFETFIKRTVFTDSSPKTGSDYNCEGKLPHIVIRELASQNWRKNYAETEFYADYANLLEEFTMCYVMVPRIDVKASYVYGSEYMDQRGTGSDLAEFRVIVDCNLSSLIYASQEVQMEIYFVVDNWIGSNYKTMISSDNSTYNSSLTYRESSDKANTSTIRECFSANLQQGGNYRVYCRDNGYIVVLSK